MNRIRRVLQQSDLMCLPPLQSTDRREVGTSASKRLRDDDIGSSSAGPFASV
jgi:hypothetical protein